MPQKWITTTITRTSVHVESKFNMFNTILTLFRDSGEYLGRFLRISGNMFRQFFETHLYLTYLHCSDKNNTYIFRSNNLPRKKSNHINHTAYFLPCQNTFELIPLIIITEKTAWLIPSQKLLKIKLRAAYRVAGVECPKDWKNTFALELRYFPRTA